MGPLGSALVTATIAIAALAAFSQATDSLELASTQGAVQVAKLNSLAPLLP